MAKADSRADQLQAHSLAHGRRALLPAQVVKGHQELFPGVTPWFAAHFPQGQQPFCGS